MPHTLLAVVNAESRVEWRDTVRHSWMRLVPKDRADAFFFRGGDPKQPYLPDEVVLDCNDGYSGLPEKVRAIFRWAWDRGYQHVLKCDDDVVLKPVDLLDSGYQHFDFVGRRNRRSAIGSVGYDIPMGFNYWLSRRSFGLVKDADLPTNNDDERWVSEILAHNNIFLHDDQRYRLHCMCRFGGRPKETNQRRALRRATPMQMVGYADMDENERAFSWAIHLEEFSGNKIPLEHKIAEFQLVAQKALGANNALVNSNQ